MQQYSAYADLRETVPEMCFDVCCGGEGGLLERGRERWGGGGRERGGGRRDRDTQRDRDRETDTNRNILNVQTICPCHCGCWVLGYATTVRQ